METRSKSQSGKTESNMAEQDQSQSSGKPDTFNSSTKKTKDSIYLIEQDRDKVLPLKDQAKGVNAEGKIIEDDQQFGGRMY